MKRSLLWIIVVVVIGLTLVLVGRLATKAGPGADGELAVAVSAEDNIKGNPNAPVTIVEYSDFQCPACAAYYPLLKQLVNERNDVKVVYRHFPLQQHQYAQFAAMVAEAAGKQGKFWEMHDLIFEKQSEWSAGTNATGQMLSYIQQLGLNLDQFQQDVSSKELKEKIQAQYRSGVKSGVRGTPTLFINGKMVQNPGNYSGLTALVDQALGINATSTATTTLSATGTAR